MPSWLPDPPSHERWRRREVWGLLLVVVLAMAGQLLALPGSAVEIDFTRDLREGFAILDGEDWPRHGPEIGGLFHLGPWWFFLVAAVLALSSSLTGYVLIMGFLASLKFLAAAWVGAQLGGPRLGMLTVAAAALPGLAVYQGLIVTHTNFVELFLWLTLGGLLSLRRTSRRRTLIFGTGLAYAAAVHAHPSTLVALPLLLIGLVWALGSLSSALRGLFWLGLGGLISLVTIVPELPALLSQSFDPSQRGPYARELGDHWKSIFPLLRSLLWAEPEALAGSAFAEGGWAPLVWRVSWTLLLGAGFLGAMFTRSRLQVVAASASLLVMALGLALLIRIPPFYSAYMLLVPLAVLLALGWLRLIGTRGTLLSVVVILALGMQWAHAIVLPRTWADGWAALRLPVADGLKARERKVQTSMFVSVSERDRLARTWCARPVSERAAINGPWARLLDVSNGYELRLAGGKACREALRFGPGPQIESGLPSGLAARLGLSGPGQGLLILPATRVIAPQQPARLSEARSYPIRLREWEAMAQAPPRIYEFEAPASHWVMVVPIQSMHAGWTVAASAEGQRLEPRVQTHDLQVFRAAQGGSGPLRWHIEVSRIEPELLSIVVLDPGS